MDGVWASVIFWGLLAIQLLGLASVVLARLYERSRVQSHCQYLFFASAILLGTATLCALALDNGWWLSSGTTLSLMGLGATLDLGR